MRFPLLRSLTLGTWEYETSTVEDHDFTDFILAHSATLESLDLGYSNYDEDAMTFESSSLSRLSPNSLPHLQSFKGNSQSLKIMAQARMKCLYTSLKCLSVGPGGVDSPTYAVEDMLDALLARSQPSSDQTPLQPLGSLKDLNFDVSQWEEREREDTFEALRRLALCCSKSLEIWRCPLPRSIGPIDASELGKLFGPFLKLQVVYISFDTMPPSDANNDGRSMEYLQELAPLCPDLQEVCVIEESATPRKSTWWRIERLADSDKPELSIHKRQW